MNWGTFGAGLLQRRPASWLRWAVNAALAVGLIAYAVQSLRGDWARILEVSRAFGLRELLIMASLMGLYSINCLLFNAVWHQLMVRFGGPSDWRRNMSVWARTHALSFLPTPAWFLAGRVRLYSESGLPWGTTLTLTAIETIMHGIAGLALFGLLSIDARNWLTWPFALALVPVAILLARPDWLQTAVRRPATTTRSLGRGMVARWLAAYGLTWALGILFFTAIVGVFSDGPWQASPELGRIWIAAGLASYVGTYTLGGLGLLREFTLVWLLGPYLGAPVPLIVAAAVRILMTVAGLVWSFAASLVVNLVLGRISGQASK